MKEFLPQIFDPKLSPFDVVCLMCVVPMLFLNPILLLVILPIYSVIVSILSVYFQDHFCTTAHE